MRTISELGFIALPVPCIGIILYGLHKVLALHYPPDRSRKIFGVTAALLALWMTVTAVLAGAGVFSDFSSLPPKLMLFVFPLLLVLIVLTFTPGMKRLLSVVPPAWLIAVQTFRVAVEILLWMLFVQNLLPVQMTFEGRNFDVLTGLTAPVVAYFCCVKNVWPKAVAVVWNILGLALLVNIVTISILSMPVPFRVFMNEPANTIVTHFPFVWLPVVLVPIAFCMHLFSLRQLLLRKA